MPTIEINTSIKSDIRICFDLARSIDLHQITTAHTNEKAIGGTTSGLIKLNEFVTWQAKHLGVTQKLSSRITALDKPFHFRDEQIKGAFKYIRHDHHFEIKEDEVLMRDIFRFQSPFGYIGRLVDRLFLTDYLTKLLTTRNNIIKEYAETGKWKTVLNERDYV